MSGSGSTAEPKNRGMVHVGNHRRKHRSSRAAIRAPAAPEGDKTWDELHGGLAPARSRSVTYGGPSIHRVHN